MALKEEAVNMGRTYQKGSLLAGRALTCIPNTATLVGLRDKQDVFSQNCRETGFLCMTSFSLHGFLSASTTKQCHMGSTGDWNH